MTELVTVWNGSHDNCDADLLCVAAPPPPTNWTIAPDRKQRALTQILEDRDRILRALVGERRTRVELRRILGLSEARVGVAMQTLLARGQIARLGWGVWRAR